MESRTDHTGIGLSKDGERLHKTSAWVCSKCGAQAMQNDIVRFDPETGKPLCPKCAEKK